MPLTIFPHCLTPSLLISLPRRTEPLTAGAVKFLEHSTLCHLIIFYIRLAAFS